MKAPLDSSASEDLGADFKKALDASALFFGTELQGPTRSMNRETFRLAISLQEGVE